MPKAEIIPLHSPIATCPECDCQLWIVHLDGFRQNYNNITVHECADCDYVVNFNKRPKDNA